MNPSPTNKAIRALLIEDYEPDARLLVRELQQAGYQVTCHRVETAAAAEDALRGGGWDIVLCDFTMPRFNGREALALVRRQDPDVPFVYVSGTIGEETAVAAMQAGAQDYVMKSNLNRLGPAVERELREAAGRRERRLLETERQQAFEKLRASEARLEQANRELARESDEMHNFCHTLSHELKTPLSAAREFVAILLDGLAGPLNPTQAEYLAIVRDSCDQLGVCIDDLFDASRLETGKLRLDLSLASLGALAQQAVAMIRPIAGKKGIAVGEVIAPDLPGVRIDENRLRQVLINLLNNAVKFTPAGGRITVRVARDVSDPGFQRVSVEDTGSGIAKDELGRVFDRLYQVKRGEAASGQGFGLGLYLCRQLVELHRGRIWAESRLGEGSAFRFTVPPRPGPKRRAVLVVDDDPAVGGFVRQALEAEEFEVRTAVGGLEALEALRQRVPEVVLLDLDMPGMDGVATLKEIKRYWGGLPVIIHTGFADGELMQRALELTPFTVLCKPCSPWQLLNTVRGVPEPEQLPASEPLHPELQAA